MIVLHINTGTQQFTKNVLLMRKRQVGKQRENIGKEIQKWEFELSQIAGYSYFRNYQALNQSILTNRDSMNVQQFADITGKYAMRNKLLKRPTGKIDIEKRLIINIFSKRTKEVLLTFSYIILLISNDDKI